MQREQVAGMTDADLGQILHDRKTHLLFELRAHVIRRKIDDPRQFFQRDRGSKMTFQIGCQCVGQLIFHGVSGGAASCDAVGNVQQEAVTFFGKINGVPTAMGVIEGSEGFDMVHKQIPVGELVSAGCVHLKRL